MASILNPVSAKIKLASSSGTAVRLLDDGTLFSAWGTSTGGLIRHYAADGSVLPSDTPFKLGSFLSTTGPTAIPLTGEYKLVLGWAGLAGSPYLKYRSVMSYFDKDGSLLYGPANHAGGGYTEMVALKYGGYVLAHTIKDSDLTGAGVSRVTATGVGSAVQVNVDDGGQQLHVKVAALESGGYVVTWLTRVTAQSYNLHASVYGAIGGSVSDDRIVKRGVANEPASVVGTADGGFLIVAQTAKGTRIGGTKYTASGQAEFPYFLDIHHDPSGGEYRPEAVALPDGGFLVVWHSRTSANKQDIMGRRYAPDLTPVGNAFKMTSDGKAKSTFDITIEDEGSIVLTWVQSATATQSGGQFVRVFGPQTFGTDDGDTLTGTKKADWIGGIGGKDVLRGGAGNDSLFGGEGNDILLGGPGKDILHGGAGADRAQYSDASSGVTVDLQRPAKNTGAAKGDKFTKIENLTGSEFDDILRGDGGGNRLDGAGGKDVLNGRKGRDVLLGGDGADKLFGDKGADRFIGGNGRDTLYAGVDLSKDVFVYKTKNDSRVGAKYRDKIVQFDPGEDYIDLTAIDANTRLAGKQQLNFSEGPAGNSIWLVDKGTDVLVRGDVTGDGRPDFEILVTSVENLLHWDFFL